MPSTCANGPSYSTSRSCSRRSRRSRGARASCSALPKSVRVTTISVVGLGKLGACAAACFAYKGYDVIGVDLNRRTVDLINEGQAPVVEPRLQEVMTAAGVRL